jgi:hypothetical protein
MTHLLGIAAISSQMKEAEQKLERKLKAGLRRCGDKGAEERRAEERLKQKKKKKRGGGEDSVTL